MKSFPGNKMLRESVVLRALILLVFLASGIVFSVHHHDLDGSSHDDCPVCFACHLCSFAMAESFTAWQAPLPPPTTAGLPREIPVSNLLLLICIGSRAPPASLS